MLRLEILKNAHKYWNILTNTEKIFALHLVLVNILRKKTSITDSVTGNLKSRDASASKKNTWKYLLCIASLSSQPYKVTLYVKIGNTEKY